MKSIVFDFGGVLLDWNPRYLFKKILKDDLLVEKFLDETGFHQWNELTDAGVLFSEIVGKVEQKAPQWLDVWKEYQPRFLETLIPIPENIKLLEDLHQQGVSLYGLTNWSNETFPMALSKYSFFSCFKDILVSGKEKLIKPDVRIFNLMLNRFELTPDKCFFLDDNFNNIKAAKSLGIYSHHVVKSAELRADVYEWLNKN